MIPPRVLARWLCVALTASVGLAPLLPPLHIHLEADDHDHHHHAAVEHSHWSAHEPARTGLHQDDEDGQVLFVDRPARVSILRAQLSRPAVAVISLPIVPIPVAFENVERRGAGNAPRDGPTRTATDLRGPPIVL